MFSRYSTLIRFANTFSHCLITYSMMSFQTQKFSVFINFNSFFFSFISFVFGIIYHRPRSQKFTLVFSFKVLLFCLLFFSLWRNPFLAFNLKTLNLFMPCWVWFVPCGTTNTIIYLLMCRIFYFECVFSVFFYWTTYNLCRIPIFQIGKNCVYKVPI